MEREPASTHRHRPPVGTPSPLSLQSRSRVKSITPRGPSLHAYLISLAAWSLPLYFVGSSVFTCSRKFVTKTT